MEETRTVDELLNSYTYILDAWSRACTDSPDRMFAVDAGSGAQMTFAEADTLSARVFRYLKERGIGKDDFVMILLPRGILPIAAILGVLKCGAAYTVLEEGYAPDRISYIRQDANCRLVIDRAVWGEILREPPLEGYVPTSPHDAAVAVYTSGSTGNPKGAVHEYGALTLCVASWMQGAFFEKRSVFALTPPLNFVAASMMITKAIYSHDEIHVIPTQILKNPKKLMQYFHSARITESFLPPSMLRVLGSDLGPWMKWVTTGGEPANGVSLDRGCALRNSYAMSESFCIATAFLLDRAYDVAPIGAPTLPLSVCLLDRDGTVVTEPKRTAELCIRLPFFRGYLNLPEENKKALCDGLFHTEDLAYYLPDGNLVIAGRANDMIKINGNRIEPAEIEAAGKRVLGVDWCAAKGFVTPKRSYIALYYTEDVTFDAQQAQKQMQALLPSYMIPSFFVKLDEIPLLPNGKVARKALEPPKIDASRPEYEAPQTPLEEALCKTFARILEVDRFGRTDDFYHMGGDSLTTLAAVSDLDFDDLSASDIFAHRTPAAIAAVYTQRLEHAQSEDPEEVEHEARRHSYPLSAIQQAYVDAFLYFPKKASAEVSQLVELPLSVDAERLANAVYAAMQNRPACSTIVTFDEDGTLCQRYAPEQLERIPVETVQEKDLEQVKKTFMPPFRMFGHPLTRARIVKTERRILLYFGLSHVMIDGMGLQLILQDICRAYHNEPLPLDTFYSALSEARQYAESPRLQADRSYYETTYADGSWTSNLEPDQNDDDLSEARIQIRSALTPERISEIETSWGTSRNTLFLAASIVALARVSGRSRILFNWTFHDRSTRKREQAAGLMIKRLPAGVDLSAYSNMRDLLDALRTKSIDAIAHSGYEWLARRENILVSDTADFVYETPEAIDQNAFESMGGASLSQELYLPGALRRFAVAAVEVYGMFLFVLNYLKGFYTDVRIAQYQDALCQILEQISAATRPEDIPVP